MNKRVVTAFLVLLLGIIILALRLKRSEPPEPPVTVETAGPSNTTQTSTHQVPSETPPSYKVSGSPSNYGSMVSQELQTYVQRRMADPEYDWRQPIAFYGMVVDAEQSPVPNANVHFKWNDLSANGTSEDSATSDAGGKFEFTGKTGKRLFVEVSKEGYYPSRRNPLAFEYANPADGLFTPDPAQPVIFHLRKKGEGADLIRGLKLFGSRIDGTVSYVDLVEGKNLLTPPGDLAVSFTRSEVNADRKFDWTFSLAAPGGGVLESTNEFMFQAPEAGYQPAYEITHKANDPNWTSQEKRRFFVKSLGGQHYARIEITIIPDYQHKAAYDLEWALNPTGLRNLEPK